MNRYKKLLEEQYQILANLPLVVSVNGETLTYVDLENTKNEVMKFRPIVDNTGFTKSVSKKDEYLSYLEQIPYSYENVKKLSNLKLIHFKKHDLKKIDVKNLKIEVLTEKWRTIDHMVSLENSLLSYDFSYDEMIKEFSKQPTPDIVFGELTDSERAIVKRVMKAIEEILSYYSNLV